MANINGTNGDDQLIGTVADDFIWGFDGRDHVDGGAGADYMDGGGGDDYYLVDQVGDVVVEGADGGRDVVQTQIDYTLGADLENLFLMGPAQKGIGNGDNNQIQGSNDTYSQLYGLNGNDSLMGGRAGAYMEGGSGNDIYDVSNLNDVVVEAVDGGIDDVTSYLFEYTLGLGVENLHVGEIEGFVGTGNELDNLITGNYNNNVLSGLGGNDYIYGYRGSDTLRGGNGNDWLNGGQGYLLSSDLTLYDPDSDSMYGGPGDDTYIVYDFNDYAIEDSNDALGGVDTVLSYADDYTLNFPFNRLGIENLTLTGHNNNNGTGNGNNNIIIGNDADNILGGLAGGDQLNGNDGNDMLIGGEGNDTLDGGAGTDILDGGTGTDTVSYASATAGVTVNLGLTTAQNTVGAGTDTLNSFESLTGGNHADFLLGDAGDNVLTGGSGDDQLYGGNGQDILYGDDGNDWLDGKPADGNDWVGVPSADSMFGGNGDDGYMVWDTGDVLTETADTVLGGVDTVTTWVDYTLGFGLENLIMWNGHEGTGNEKSNIIYGNDNGVVLSGLDGDDRLHGGSYVDLLDGGSGDDILDGGTGTDTVSYASAAAGVRVNLGLATAQSTVGAGTDTLTGFENITGSNYADILIGDAGNNVITGGLGDDQLNGYEGNDTLLGNNGNDRLDGQGGDDTMDGGAGNDIYIVQSFFDVVAETANDAAGGVDLVESAVTHNMGFGIENLTLIGTQGVNGTGNVNNNILLGNVSDNGLFGLDGNDTLDGGAGNDILDGGAGVDTVLYASATAGVTVNLGLTTAQNTGGAGTDTLSNFENLTGSNFSDNLSGNSGNNVLDGAAGTDTLSYAMATAGVTVNLSLTTAQNTVGAGTDTLSNFENLTGSNFNDQLLGDAGNNALNGGAGTDTVSYTTATAAVTVNLSLTTAQNTVGAGTDTLSNFENLRGSNFNDTLTGDAKSNILIGGLGNDLLNGGAAVDIVSYETATTGVTVSLLLAGAQNTMGAGTDTLSNLESLRGSNFNDTLTGNGGTNILTGGAGNDVLDGDAGSDTASYETTSAGVTVSLAVAGVQNTVGAGTDTLSNFENLRGSNFNDTLTGNAASNVLIGHLGNDVLDGGVGTDTASYETATTGVTVSLAIAGAQNTVGAGTDTLVNFEHLRGGVAKDTLTGNGGSNIITGGLGNDVLDGGAGTDTASYDTAFGGVTVNLGMVGAQNTGNAGADTLSNFENLKGSIHNDVLTGNAANNILIGDQGNDVINGDAGIDTASYETAKVGVTVSLAIVGAQNTVGEGTDTLSNFENLRGGNFNDTLTGNAGVNQLTGGLGNDTMVGGSGQDSFVFNTALNAATNTDTITDFSPVDDTLVLENAIFTQFVANGAIPAGTFVANAGGVAGDANDYLLYNTTTGTVSYDADGNGAGAAVAFVTLVGIPALTAADFTII